MEVTGATTTTAAAAGNQSSDTQKPVISSDFETFIKMLTTQMKNQDPLNPIESADFAVQLATFSSVEQQVLTNNLLTELGGQMNTQSLGPLSGWLGMEATAVMPVIYSGDPIELQLTPDTLADSVELVVRNSQGDEIQRYEVAAASGRHQWMGRDAFGNALPSGTYDIQIESYSNGDLLSATQVEVVDHITEIRNQEGQPQLIMQGGQVVQPDQILGLRSV